MNLTSYSTFTPRSDNGRFVTQKVEGAVLEGITQWAEKVLETAQELVPVDTAELRDSGHVVVNSAGKRASVAVVFDAPHSVYVEFGTGIRGAESPGAGPGPYSSNWAGMPAQPYLRPAFDEHAGEATGMTAAIVTAAVK